MKIIFVSCVKNAKKYKNDPSFIYRCENLAQGLKEFDCEVELLHMSKLSYRHHTNADVVVFHRPKYSKRLHLLLIFLRFQSKVLIADYDDLIFDPKFVSQSPAFLNGMIKQEKIQKEFENNKKALNLFQNFSVSTFALQEHILKLLPKSNIITIPNAVHHTWHDKKLQKNCGETKKLLYLPGTKSHDRDFSLIKECLETFLNNHKDVALHITGELDFHLDVNQKQIIHQPRVPFDEYYKIFCDGWLNIAPLEVTSFNMCKSALKIFEAGYWNIPTVCARNKDNERFEDCGAMIANTPQDWLKILEFYYSLNQNKKNIKHKVLAIANYKQTARIFLKFVLSSHNLIYIANNRRAQGKYDYYTLRLYKESWLQSGLIQNYLQYLLFRRDLGYTLSAVHKRFLEHNLLDLKSYKDNKHATLLLAEKDQKKYLAAYDRLYSNEWLVKVRKNEEKSRKKFLFSLKNASKKGICIVGNSGILRGSKKGSFIDAHAMVIRFNLFQSRYISSEDIGSKLNVWVCAPDFSGSKQEAEHTIISGVNTLYKGGRNLSRLFSSVDTGLSGVPINVWKFLVHELKAPPSAGVLILAWIREILGSFDGICVLGFDSNTNTKNYHHADPNHKAGIRHNWKLEQKLLLKWEQEGLVIHR